MISKVLIGLPGLFVQKWECALGELVALKRNTVALGERPFAENLFLIGEAVLRAALMRNESRGPHLL